MSPRSGAAGFTLIELLVVIVIISLIGGLVVLRQPVHSAGLDFDASRRGLIAALRLARSRAIAQDRVVTVLTGSAGFSVDGSPAQRLAANQGLSAGAVMFLPDGGASGGPLVLAWGSRQAKLEVNWLTGRVHVAESNAK